MTWSVYGKPLTATSSLAAMTFTYDATGNRISKTSVSGGNTITTWYVRDGQGKVMAVYTLGDPTKNSGALTQSEVDLYGLKRLGLLTGKLNCSTLGTRAAENVVARGAKIFELNNHLGNVLVTISDKKLQQTTDNNTVAYYTADVINANDYYSFGMPMPGRTYTLGSAAAYRYGFNGKEQDPEVKGQGDQYDYGKRMYDPRVGKFLSLDPLSSKYTFYSPYQFAANSPIYAVDIDGLEVAAILNRAESLLNTPYEFGGKEPSPALIGSLANPEKRKFWENELKPELQHISDGYPDHVNAKIPFATAYMGGEERFLELWKFTVDEVHQSFNQYTQNGKYDLGIDCSGFVFKSYSMDKELLMDAGKLATGADKQIDEFRKAEKKGQAYVHTDFNLLSAGDLIQENGHVMIATGNVVKDASGNIIKFETIEAAGTAKGSVIQM